MDHCPLYQGKLHFLAGFLWEVAVTQTLEPPSASYTGCGSVIWREYIWCAPHLLSALSDFYPHPPNQGEGACRLSPRFHFRVLLLSQNHCWSALLLSFIFLHIKSPLAFLDVNGTFPYDQWSCTLPISTFLVFWSFRWESQVTWVAGTEKGTSVLILLSYSELGWSVHLSTHLANCPADSDFEKFRPSLIIFLFPCDSTHLVSFSLSHIENPNPQV